MSKASTGVYELDSLCFRNDGLCPWLKIPKRPMRSWEKLAGYWYFGDDEGGMLSVLKSNKCSLSIFW